MLIACPPEAGLTANELRSPGDRAPRGWSPRVALDEARPPRGPRATDGRSIRLPRLHAVLIAAVSAAYLASLWFNFTEAERRSVSLEIPPVSADYLQMDVDVVYVDLLRSEITTRISFRLAGRLAQDELTPATDLQLVLNSSKGQQQFDFPKGERINPVEVVFPLKGDVNFYPFDHHKGVLWLFVTFPAKQIAGRPNPEPKVNIVPEGVANAPGLPVSTSSLEQQMQVDTRTTFTSTASWWAHSSFPTATFAERR